MVVNTDASPHIVVLGAGFAGLHFVRHYRGPGRITIIDRQNHHLFQPLLYQVATAALSATEIATPIRSVLKNKRNVSVVMDQVESIDLEKKSVTTGRAPLQFDYLVIALGGQTSYFGHPEWEEHAPGLKSLADALLIRTRMLECFELAETSDSPADKARLMRTVIIGGGPTGVEMAGAMADLTRKIFSNDFRHIQPEHSQIILVDGGERLLTPYHSTLSASAKKQLESLGVEVHLDTFVTDIKKGVVELKKRNSEATERIEAGTIVWGGGVRAVGITEQLEVAKDRIGRLQVAPDLSLPGHPAVFAVGDIVSLTQEDGSPVPGVAPAALQMGANVAKTIQARLENPNAAASSFRYWDKGSLATIGRSKAVAQFGRFELSGFIAWISWLLIHLLFLVGFRNKLITLIQWFYQYFTFRTGARIIPRADLTFLEQLKHAAEPEEPHEPAPTAASKQ